MQLQQKDKHSKNSYIRSQRKKLKYHYESKRKVTPILGEPIQYRQIQPGIVHQQLGNINYICESYCQQKVQILNEIKKYCQHKHKGLKTTVNQQIHAEIKAQQFVFNEFFISNCDQMYLSKNYMQDILKKCQFQSVTICKNSQKQERVLSELKLPKLKEFKGIQQALPKPHLLSQQFIDQERSKMHQNRINMRTRNQNYSQTSIQKNIKFLAFQIEVGQEVWAFCPLCQLLHRGTVLSQYKDSYLVNFDQPLFGALKVPEQFITTKLGNSKYIQWSSLEQSKSGSKDRNEKEYKINVQALSAFISFLQMKKELLIKLRQFNNNAQNKKSQSLSPTCVSALDEIQIQQYGWIGTCINIITVATRYIENNYSIILRDKQSDNRNLLGRQKCFKNSRLSLLAMSDSYCNMNTSANEQYEENKYEKIKNIEKKEEMMLNQHQLLHNQQEQVNNDDLGCVQESAKLSLGILQNLQKRGKNYRIQDDENYIKLEQKYKDEYAGQIKEVHSKLKNIIKKLSH